MPRNPKGSTPRKGPVQIQVFFEAPVHYALVSSISWMEKTEIQESVVLTKGFHDDKSILGERGVVDFLNHGG